MQILHIHVCISYESYFIFITPNIDRIPADLIEILYGRYAIVPAAIAARRRRLGRLCAPSLVAMMRWRPETTGTGRKKKRPGETIPGDTRRKP
jgi:hypothetical protein